MLIKQIAVGEAHTLLLDNEGKVYVTGFNMLGQLGTKDIERRHQFQLIPSLPYNMNGVAIAAGSSHSMILTSNNELWVSGDNRNGQLGIASTKPYINTFKKVTILPQAPQIKAIAAGNNHSLVLFENGDLYVSGSNSYGQLGLGNYTNINVFQLVKGFPINTKIVSIYSRSFLNGSFLLSDDGSVFACGDNSFNQLGLDELEKINFYRKIDSFPVTTKIFDISPGLKHTFFLSDKGILFGVGSNNFGQLGLNEDDSKPNLFMAPEVLQHNMDSNPDFDALRYINLYKLSVITTLPSKDYILQMTCGFVNSFIKTSNGVFFSGSSRDCGLPLKESTVKYFQPLTSLLKQLEVILFESSKSYGLFIDVKGDIYGFGTNYFGQLGVEGSLSSNILIKIPLPIKAPSDQHKNPATLQTYRSSKLTINPYELDAFLKIASQTNETIASEIFMPHLFGCNICKCYVKPTVWGQCPYPHARPSTPLAATSAAVSASAASAAGSAELRPASPQAKIAKPDEVGSATSDDAGPAEGTKN